MFIEVQWFTETDPGEENHYLVTTETREQGVVCRNLDIAHYDPAEGWDRDIVAWTDAWVSQYTDDYM